MHINLIEVYEFKINTCTIVLLSYILKETIVPQIKDRIVYNDPVFITV
jgi:hypothetical protein